MENVPSNHILDPRGVTGQEDGIALAERPSREDLADGSILFYDNGKLGAVEYMEVYRVIRDEFERRDLGDITYVEETVRGKETGDFKARAAEFADEGYDAAILALGDKGTTLGTTALAIELEKADIPTVFVTSPPGAKLAEAVATLRAGRLCLCPLDIYQGSTAQDVRAETEGQIEFIIESLSLPADELGDRAEPGVTLDEEAPTGTLSVPGLADVGEGIEPGAFVEETMNRLEALDIGDGLPVVPPTQRRLDEMMAYSPVGEQHTIVREAGPSGADIRVRDVALAAVMAGCKPAYMPILLTAFEAMTDRRYNFLQSVTTSNPAGNLIVVSGPIARELGIHAGQGCLGPGFRANATIGRAISLVLIDRCRAVPGKADLDCLASPAEYTYCFAEDPALTPWTTINEERFDAETTTVYALKAESPTNVLEFLSDSADALIESFVDAASNLGSNNAYITGPLVVVLVPDHARVFAEDGWDKRDIRTHLHEHVRWPRERLEGRGIDPVRPDGFDDMDMIPVTRSPDDIEVVVAGGPGGHSAVIRPWAMYSDGIVKPVTSPDGQAVSSVEQYR